MNAPKFTAGPWRQRNGAFFGADGERLIQGRPVQEVRANHALIAAAPELYEALAEAVKWADEMDTGDVIDGDPIASWRAALAKAVQP
jgi:hypothetical protein